MRHGDRAPRNLPLGGTRPARQLLNCAAINIAGGEIHLFERLLGAQNPVYRAEVFKQVFPIDIGDAAQTGDNIAHRHSAGALNGMLQRHHGINVGGLFGQTLVQPRQRRGNTGVLIPQPVHQLNRHRGRQRHVLILKNHLERFRRNAARSKQPVCDSIGRVALAAAAADAFRQPAQVFNQHNPQRDRNRPQLANRQWLNFLIGAHIIEQALAIKIAVRMRDIGPGQPENPWIPGKRTRSELW